MQAVRLFCPEVVYANRERSRALDFFISDTSILHKHSEEMTVKCGEYYYRRVAAGVWGAMERKPKEAILNLPPAPQGRYDNAW